MVLLNTAWAAEYLVSASIPEGMDVFCQPHKNKCEDKSACAGNIADSGNIRDIEKINMIMITELQTGMFSYVQSSSLASVGIQWL
ncbi:hypothetical protein BPOR_0018g00160 [Botrytis porri]|uniref:Uncharacterized protein n=1 Tax=Botrytis porri TaxID=87229 RepID=A0A4Z1L4Q5_9HELO|nr:hypothetical protein BPOR_0018g00160 [Botrytis porri]